MESMEMNRRAFLKTSAAAVLVGATAMVCPSALPKAEAAEWLTKTYTVWAVTTEVYKDKTLTRRSGEAKYGAIYSNDELYVLDGSLNGNWIAVSYPITGTKNRKVGYIHPSNVFVGGNDRGIYTPKQITTYKRPNGAEYGKIYAGESFSAFGTVGAYTQVIYEITNGWKYAFVKTADLKGCYSY